MIARWLIIYCSNRRNDEELFNFKIQLNLTKNSNSSKWRNIAEK